MVMGEGAGTAAAISIHSEKNFRDIDIKQLQQTLVKNGVVL